MSRLPGLGVARTLIALIFLAAVVGVGAFSAGLIGGGRAGPSASPTLVAGEPSPTASPSLQPTPSETLPISSPGPSPSPAPSDGVVAYTNPDGKSPGSYPYHEYPFVALAQTLPTYGLIWVDPNQTDWHIGVTADIPAAIATLKDAIPRGITVYFYLVDYTSDQLCSLMRRIIDDADELAALGIWITAGGCGNKEMTIDLTMTPVTPETIAFMRARYDGPLSFEDGGDFPLRDFSAPVFGQQTLQAVSEDAESNLLWCGRRPFPVDALAAPDGAESGSGRASEALRFALAKYEPLFPDLPQLTWKLAESDTYGATFLAKRPGGWLEVSVYAGTGQWAPGTLKVCDPKPFTPADGGDARWWLDPNYPLPDRASTELHLFVVEMACTGSSSPEGRVLPPVVQYTTDALQMTLFVRGLGGLHMCPGNPYFPVTVLLPNPLGDRDLQGAAPPPH